MFADVSPTDAHIRDWLKALGVLVAASMSAEEASSRIDALTPHLAAEFPPGAFCRASLTAVARQCRYFPNLAEACDALAPWWREHRQLPPSLPEPIPRLPPLRSLEEAEAAHRIVLEAVAELRANDNERAASYAKSRPFHKPQHHHLTRAELNEAYRRAGIRGPQVLQP